MCDGCSVAMMRMKDVLNGGPEAWVFGALFDGVDLGVFNVLFDGLDFLLNELVQIIDLLACVSVRLVCLIASEVSSGADETENMRRKARMVCVWRAVFGNGGLNGGFVVSGELFCECIEVCWCFDAGCWPQAGVLLNGFGEAVLKVFPVCFVEVRCIDLLDFGAGRVEFEGECEWEVIGADVRVCMAGVCLSGDGGSGDDVIECV